MQASTVDVASGAPLLEHNRTRRRLRLLVAQVVPTRARLPSSGKVAAHALAPLHVPGPPSVAPPQLLTDHEMRKFVAQGYVTLPVSSLSRDFHQQFYAAAEAVHRTGQRGLATSVLAEATDAVLHQPKVRGALASILGPDFVGGAWMGYTLRNLR